MTESQAIEAIYEQWQAGWEALHSATPADATHVPYAFRNEAYTPAPGSLGAWARVSVGHTVAGQVTAGSAGTRRFERLGFITVQLFAPINTGTKLLAQLADDVRTVLEARGMTVSGAEPLHTHTARTEEMPEDGEWSMAAIVIPFRYVDTR